MRVIDLSQPIYTGMPVYPGDPEVRVEVIHTLAKEHWELRQLELGSHSGTHVDAFSHMHSGAAHLDQIPLERFFGPAMRVTAEGEWPTGIGLFFHEPVDENLAERIISANPGFVGGPLSEALERRLLQAEIITYTGLIQLDQIPLGKQFQFFGLPLRIQAGDGSPVRAIALINDDY